MCIYIYLYISYLTWLTYDLYAWHMYVHIFIQALYFFWRFCSCRLYDKVNDTSCCFFRDRVLPLKECAELAQKLNEQKVTIGLLAKMEPKWLVDGFNLKFGEVGGSRWQVVLSLWGNSVVLSLSLWAVFCCRDFSQAASLIFRATYPSGQAQARKHVLQYNEYNVNKNRRIYREYTMFNIIRCL